MSLSIQIRDQQTTFAPRDRIIGEVSWRLGAPPKNAELRLLWGTTGRGTDDIGLVEAIPFTDPQATQTRPFTFTLPDGPYSFRGSLISLHWALELVVEPGDETARVDLIVAPAGKVVSLPAVSGSERVI